MAIVYSRIESEDKASFQSSLDFAAASAARSNRSQAIATSSTASALSFKSSSKSSTLSAFLVI